LSWKPVIPQKNAYTGGKKASISWNLSSSGKALLQGAKKAESVKPVHSPIGDDLAAYLYL
jgi:hypothetical protein